jgi:hypothetical protein
MHIPDAGAAVFERELQIEQWAARNVFSLVRGAVCFFRMLVFKSKGMVHLLCTKIASRVRKDGAKLKNELRQTWRATVDSCKILRDSARIRCGVGSNSPTDQNLKQASHLTVARLMVRVNGTGRL